MPLFRPEVGAYLANERQAAGMFLHSLHDRLGEPQWIETQAFDDTQDRRKSAWVRIVSRDTEAATGDGRFGVESNTQLIQAGGDVARWAVGGDSGRLHVGGMFGYGQTKTDASAQYNPRGAHGKVEGWSLGLYGTWYQNDENKLGAYVDAWGTYGWFNSSVQGDRLPQVKYDASAITLSLEGGYAFKAGNSGWVLEPQVQVAYIRYEEDDISEPNGTTITGHEGSGWISRLGVRIHRTWVRDDGRKVQPYLTLNWWHDNLDNAEVFNTVRVQNIFPDDRYEAKLGVNADLSRGWTAWGNFGYQWGDQSYRSRVIRLGAKYTW